MSFKSEFTKGIIKENPTFRLLLGMCPTLATSLAVSNAIGMGLAATFVLVGSNVIISALRRVTPEKIRIPIFIVVIATFVTTVDLIMAAFVPGLHEVLGIFIPLIVVNCIIFARAEAFAFQHGVMDSLADGLGMGLGFTLALSALSAIRELRHRDYSGFSDLVCGFAFCQTGCSHGNPRRRFITIGLLKAC